MTTSDHTDLVHGPGWEWRKPRRGDHFRTCSYCGSIHPEDLAAEIGPAGACTGCGGTGFEEHYRRLLRTDDITAEHQYDPGNVYASWADRKYGWPHKFYVEGLRPRNPKLLHCFSHTSGEEQPQGYGYPWTAAKDLTRTQKKILQSDGMLGRGEKPYGWYAFRPKGALFAKFYTKHLADPQVSTEVVDKIVQASGVRLHFTADGRVAWHSAAVPCTEMRPPC